MKIFAVALALVVGLAQNLSVDSGEAVIALDQSSFN